MTNVFTIPPDASFVEALAKGLWNDACGDPLSLSRGLVLLPTRRACRHLRDAFLRVTNGQATLLPRLQPLGDADESDLFFADTFDDPSLPPAIAPLRRQMMLTKLVAKKDPALPIDQAAQMAKALAELVDQVQIARGSFANLHNLVPQFYAEHWQETIRFLDIVTTKWPDILKEEGCLDPAERRNRVLEMRTENWRKAPPPYPVIAAGSTGSVPAVADLMAVIAEMPQGRVVLPGLDRHLDEESWQALDENHPQFGMRAWLEGIKLKRADVKDWPMSDSPRPARVRLLEEVMRPAATSEAWREIDPNAIPATALRGLSLVELDHQQEEAEVIALRLRAALEEPNRTAALVTPDRALAQRVAAALRRWGIEANDSAGAPLISLPVGSFLRDAWQAAAPDASAIDYLSLLKHPLTTCGLESAECRQRARHVEIKTWRGVRRANGWKGAALALQHDKDPLAAWLCQIAQWFESSTLAWDTLLPLEERIVQHLALAEKLTGRDQLWRSEAGDAASAFFDDWRLAGAGLPPLSGDDYLRLFTGLCRDIVVRPTYGAHPRLSLLGPLEARLHHADLMILGGLNEDVWPPASAVDPWMSRPMKHNFGLPSPERRVGLSAHDFVEQASAPDVLLTRARRVGASPTVPSRFLLRFDAVIKALGYPAETLQPDRPWREWAKRFDTVANPTPCDKPQPRPPLDARPKRLHVTSIGAWKRNPYAIYAKYILGLRKLDDIDQDIDAADRGTLIHEVLERFLAQHKDVWPTQPLETLLAIGREVFAPLSDRPQVAAFWWPRFEQVANWFIAEEQRRRQAGIRTLGVECEGEFRLGDFILEGRADRLDRLPDGSIEIVDYKTGTPPPDNAIQAGYEPQLPLLGLIAEEGGFAACSAARVSALAHWHLKGKRDDKTILPIKGDTADLIRRSCAQLKQLIAAFADPKAPYEATPKPRYAPKYDDYAHLSRNAEWGRTEGDA